MSLITKKPYTAEVGTLELDAAALPTQEVAVPALEKRDLTNRILLLDDDADFREIIQDYLSPYFSQITAVSNGAEGLREVMKDPFDVILCDMMMPKLNGEMFYWAVTRLRPAAGQRFLFVTAHENKPTVQSFFQRINAVVLIKPFQLDALLSAIHAMLARLR